MPAYHSVFNALSSASKMCGIPALEFKSGKSPSLDVNKLKVPLAQIEVDIIDEAIMYFRANILFKNYAIQGDADKLIVYLTVFIQKCLEKANNPDVAKAKDSMRKLVEGCEYIPKTENFFNVLVTMNNSQLPNLQKYLKSLRKETVERMIYLLFDDAKTKLDYKFWVALSKKKFMGYEMMTAKGV